MSVLIKGMKMPQYGCDHCFLRTGNYCGMIEKDEIVVEYAKKSERHPDCPLVPVPPHGDLIDREPFIQFIKTHWDSYDQWVVEQLEARPTIIPAEEEV